MKRSLVSLFLLITICFASIGFTGCNDSVPGQPPLLKEAAFSVINFIKGASGIFNIAQSSILLTKDAIKLVETIRANQNPPKNTASDHIRVSILYNKQGIESQDVYDVGTGKASLGIFFEGGQTFESFSANNVDIDATHTSEITIVPLQSSLSTFTVSATKGWQKTGIFLQRGRPFQLKYLSGIWTAAKNLIGTSDAAGQPAQAPDNILCNCGEPLPGYSIQGLIGRIGSGEGYTPLQINDDFSGVSYTNDFLYLRMNEPDPLLPYASGSITVSIQTNNS